MKKIRGRWLLFMMAAWILAMGSTVSARGKTFLEANRITDKVMEQMDLEGVNRVMIVAHPDDETLWGGMHLLKNRYLVICLTNANTRKYGKIRSNEFEKVMQKTGSTGIILNYPDLNKRNQRDNWKKCSKQIQKDLMTVLTYKNWVEVATHNPQGEYGHNQHKMTSRLTTRVFQKAKLKNATLKYFGKYHGKKYRGSTKWSKSYIRKKREVMKVYRSQRSIHTFGHMAPYENWTTGR